MSHIAMLSAVASVGADRHVLAMLAGLADVDLGDAEQQHWLFGPLVVHQSAWIGTLPEWAKRQALAERWLIVAGELSDHIVGPTEMMCVMYPATMEAPLSSDASDLYLWAAQKAIISHYGSDSDSAKAAAEINRLTDNDVLTAGGRLYYDYRELAHEIRRKVVKARQAELREARKVAKTQEPQTTDKQSQPATRAAQFALFE